MKCPKCGYLGFDDVERCRNCGYDFGLAVEPPPQQELEIRRRESGDEVGGALDDLPLADAGGVSDRADPAPTPALTRLPLFGGEAGDDLPLITRPSPPRPPLAVRRATPDVPRTRTDTPRPPLLDLPGPPVPEARPRAARRDPHPPEPAADAAAPAAMLSRLAAVAIDLAVLAVIDLVVVYFTLQICGLTVADLDILPKGPLIAFLFVQNGGYLVAFTAGGQTLGKMAMGIKVVSAAAADEQVDVARSALRTLVWLLLAIPGGLGFVTALFSRERRGLHDRFAGTRVIKGVG